MIFEKLRIPDVVLIKPRKFGDNRGYFMETFREALFHENVCLADFIQENRSLSAQAGTVRGLHFQLPPKAQGKLVTCTAGTLLDVAVDLRHGSPTYGQYVSAELTADGGEQIWVPPGFAHGFCTLVPDTVISYKVTDYYSPEHDRGVLWNDPGLGIEWPIGVGQAILSDKDKTLPTMAEMIPAFTVEN